MNHLSDEQLEEVLQGWAPEPDHVACCQQCRTRLEEQRAIRTRLRSAFASVRADNGLIDSIRSSLRPTEAAAAPCDLERSKPVRRVRRLLWPALAAAAVLVIGLPLGLYLVWPGQAAAAEGELWEIHQHGRSSHTDLYVHADPEEVAAYLHDKLGFRPAFPRLGVGMALRGCCVAHFRKKPAGSYVVDTDRGVISIIVVTEKKQVLGLTGSTEYKGRTYAAGSYRKCRMVAIELQGYTYCAVGEVPYAFLAELLDRLGLSDEG